MKEATQDETPSDLIRGKGRILVMDDEEEIQDILGKMLQHLGFEVDFANGQKPNLIPPLLF